MFIFYEFRPFFIDNARVIYRKIRYVITQHEDLQSTLRKASGLAFRRSSASFSRHVYLTTPAIVLHFTSIQVNNCHSVPTTGLFDIRARSTKFRLDK